MPDENETTQPIDDTVDQDEASKDDKEPELKEPVTPESKEPKDG